MTDYYQCSAEELTGWAKMFDCISPHFWGYVGVAFSIVFSIIGAGL